MFYERYLQLCDSKGLKPSTAAERAGFNRGTVSVWKKKYKENIDVRPEPDVIEKICSFFNCSESWLLGIEEQKEKAPAKAGAAKSDITFDDFTYALYGETRNLTDAEKQLLLSMARQLNEAKRSKNE